MAGDIIMSQQSDHDAEFTALHTEINKAYHQPPLEQPSAELDEAILTKARSDAHVSANNTRPKKSPWQRYTWGFSSAASVLLVAGLFLLNPSLQQYVGIDIEPALPAQPALSQQAKMLSTAVTAEKSIAVEGLSMSAAPVNDDSANNAPANSESISEVADINASVERLSTDKQPALMRAAPQLESDVNSASLRADSAKQAVATKANDVAAQKKAVELQSHRHDKEAPLMKQQFDGSFKGDIQLDTADVALARLQALMADNKLIEAERYMITMDQRFPELSSSAHPLYKQYQKIKVQLTSQ
jgi:hypothetical protein